MYIIILLIFIFANFAIKFIYCYLILVFNCLASVDKTRKIAENKYYTSCEGSQLGKSCRTKIPNKQIYSTSDSEEDKEEERKTTNAKETQSRKRKSNRNLFHDSSSDNDDDINNNNNETQEIGRKKLKPNLPQWPNYNENQIDDTFSQSQSALKSTANENNEISDDGKCIVEHIKNLF